MNQQYHEVIARELRSPRSRRKVLGTATKGAIGGLGTALIARGFDLGLRDGEFAPAARAQGVTVSIVDFDFEPETIEIPVGTEVTWINDGDEPHTATSSDGVTFDSSELNPGQSFSNTFDAVGEFDYFCVFHGASIMSGTVTVIESAPRTYTRPNVYSLDPAGPELTAYAKAVEKMKQLPDTDPTSWLYQAYIHGMPREVQIAKFEEFGLETPAERIAFLGERGWLTCEHHTAFFWSWHRCFLYWFERIVRELGEYPDFALPYWDYSNPAQRKLPEAFRDRNSSLYVEKRDPLLNNGKLPILDPPAQNAVFDNICRVFSPPVFLAAQIGLETTPHDNIHGWVGGDFTNPCEPGQPCESGLMSAIATSAQDPIFWLHHANMDRLWSSWLAVPGNVIQQPDAWLDNDVNNLLPGVTIPYSFFDEFGTKVTKVRTAREVLDSKNDLFYDYEELFPSDDFICQVIFEPVPSPEADVFATPEATPPVPVELGRNNPPGGAAIGPDPVTLPISLPSRDAERAVTRGDRVVLTVEGIRGGGVFGTVFEVYVNLPPGEQPDFNSPYFVGNISLFGRQPQDEVALFGEEMGGHMAMQQFDISSNVAVLQARGEWTDDLTVTLVPYAPVLAPPEEVGTPVAEATPMSEPPGPWVTIAGVAIDTK